MEVERLTEAIVWAATYASQCSAGAQHAEDCANEAVGRFKAAAHAQGRGVRTYEVVLTEEMRQEIADYMQQVLDRYLQQ